MPSIAYYLRFGSSADGLAGSHTILRIVAILVTIYFVHRRYVVRSNLKKSEAAIAKQNNCEPVLPYLPYKWPLAIDLIKRQFDIFFSDNTFERLTPYFDVADTCRIHLFGHTGYFTTDPLNVETILTTKFEDYTLGSRPLASHPLLGEGIFAQDGPAWKQSRALIRRQFVRVQKQTPLAFAPLAERLVRDIAQSAVDGQVDLKPLMFEYTLSTTTLLLFGEPHSNMAKADREAVRENFDYASFGCGIRVRLADLAWAYDPPNFRRACRAVREWATFFVSKAFVYMDKCGEDAAADKYPFIIDLWKEMRDVDLVRDQLLHVLVAGRDSTACLLSWTFFHLVRNPEVLQRLQDEIARVPTDGNLSREVIERLPFLRCCLNETLRLYPTLPMNIRFANKATILPRGGGHDGMSPVMLPAGSGIAYSVYHLHRKESIYGADSRIYRPQRWESGELIKTARSGAGYVDFNAGPRLCLGKDFALMEASYAIIRVLQSYPNIQMTSESRNVPAGTEKQTYTIGLSPTDGVHVRLSSS